jgi:hypothetical protein
VRERYVLSDDDNNFDSIAVEETPNVVDASNGAM